MLRKEWYHVLYRESVNQHRVSRSLKSLQWSGEEETLSMNGSDRAIVVVVRDRGVALVVRLCRTVWRHA